uniref:Uncharacterized protein n=1 Tax=Candidatus Kentrum sp. FW TaxID=2126338 RepID=A0A450U4C7_9GAMM|nr:MAG: hypothetical protein BECKFW1821C_GA0114237_11852 [Candidatus Kentron sp. FW]
MSCLVGLRHNLANSWYAIQSRLSILEKTCGMRKVLRRRRFTLAVLEIDAAHEDDCVGIEVSGLVRDYR